MPPSSPTTPLTDGDSIRSALSSAGVTLRLDDDASGTVDATEDDRLDQAVGVGTATVTRYTQTRYDTTDLTNSWTVWDWATTLAAVWLCRRCGNAVPKSLLRAQEDIMEDLRSVQAGQLLIEDVAKRTTDAPGFSSVIVDPFYRGKKIRVQRRQGDGVRRERRPAIDHYDDRIVEP